MKKKKIKLIIEYGDNGYIWGRIKRGNHLIIDSANSLSQLKRKMNGWVKPVYKIDPSTVEYVMVHEVATFFEDAEYLNVSAVAKRAGINASLMRQYSSGHKLPGKKAAARIQNTIKEIAKELAKTKIASA